ncbi:RPA-related protein RADX-like [Stigmatopora nigra]
MSTNESVLRQTVRRATAQRNQAICEQMLDILGVYRYTRDPSSQAHFPSTFVRGQDLYDVVLGDGRCRLNLTLDPSLNWLVEENALRSGAVGRNASLFPLDLPMPGQSFVLTGVDVCSTPEVEQSQGAGAGAGAGDGAGNGQDLPWITTFTATAPIMADRKVYLPLWNNVDYFGSSWRKLPPARESVSLTRVTVSGARRGFLDCKDWALTPIRSKQMTVRVMQKSHLMYYGQPNKRGQCPYRALLEVSDHTGSVTVVLWDEACLDWYCVLKPGDVICLRNFQIKPLYQSQGQDIEIGINTKFPKTLVTILPSTAGQRVAPYVFLQSFFSSKDLKDLPDGSVCDAVGLVIFAGRPERIRQGLLLMEYRWLVLADGRHSELIRIKLFSTSQPDAHRQLLPGFPVVCCGLKAVRTDDGLWYLTNTPYASLHCSGVDKMEDPPVRALLEWLGRKESQAFRESPLMGGFFAYPPTPDTVQAYTMGSSGAPPLFQGNEILREMKGLSYMERKTLSMLATISQVTYYPRGEREQPLLWRDSSEAQPGWVRGSAGMGWDYVWVCARSRRAFPFHLHVLFNLFAQGFGGEEEVTLPNAIQEAPPGHPPVPRQRRRQRLRRPSFGRVPGRGVEPGRVLLPDLPPGAPIRAGGDAARALRRNRLPRGLLHLDGERSVGKSVRVGGLPATAYPSLPAGPRPRQHLGLHLGSRGLLHPGAPAGTGRPGAGCPSADGQEDDLCVRIVQPEPRRGNHPQPSFCPLMAMLEMDLNVRIVGSRPE